MDGIDGYAIAMIAVFVIGYAMITLEHVTKINKATVALLMAIICWVIQFANVNWHYHTNLNDFTEHLSSISQVIFFLLGALSVVEIMNAHDGFSVISDSIQISCKRKLLWVIGILSFCLSAILDNLTTTIVMITLLQKLIDKGEDRLLIGGAVVIAANAGGAWTPIGDVTTTMLWIGGQVSTVSVMKTLFLPSVVCMLASMIVISFMLKGREFTPSTLHLAKKHNEPMSTLIFVLGTILLAFVPVFKILTGLPPFMGILLALSVLWIITDIVHGKYEDREHLLVPNILGKIDISGMLFFLGILLAIDALATAKILEKLAVWLDNTIGNTDAIAVAIGLASAVVDNVPLVAASMGMYSIEQYPQNHQFWEMIAFCAGTGGSILIIGSAAGVVFMGLEKANFGWYLKKISFAALVGYFAGISFYIFVM